MASVLSCFRSVPKQILSKIRICHAIHNAGKCFSNSYHYDIIISGGGMVGTAMAAALACEPVLEDKKILLLEAGHPKTSDVLPPVHSSRVCALSPGTVDLLSEIGAWQNILDARYREVKRMQVWDSCSYSMITFNQDQLVNNLAYIIENDVILAAIMKQVEQYKDKIEIRQNAKVTKYQLGYGAHDEEHLSVVELEDGTSFSTKLLIGADGFKSMLRQTAGFHTTHWNYDQFAVVATLKLAEGADNNTAWQRFLPTGPVALLPLSEEYSCLIWSTTTEEAKTLLKLPGESFVDAVNNAFWSDADISPVVDTFSQGLDTMLTSLGFEGSSSRQLPPTVLGVEDSTRGMFPLGFCHSSQYVQSGVAIIGDAAHRIHPMAGQGVNLGFGDVKCLKENLAEGVYAGQDIGALPTLLEYERQRQGHVVPMMAGIDGLKRLYSTSWTPVVLMRTLGLQTTNALRPLKDRLINQATS